MTITTSIPPRRIRLQAEDAGHPFHGNQYRRESEIEQPEIPTEGVYPAVRLKGGTLLPITTPQTTHIMFLQDKKIHPDDVASGGWIKDGSYEPSDARSDTLRWKEREQAKIRVSEKRLSRLSSSNAYSRRPADKRTAGAAAAGHSAGRRPAAELRAGDVAGHEFHGNQYGAIGSKEWTAELNRRVAEEMKKNPLPKTSAKDEALETIERRNTDGNGSIKNPMRIASEKDGEKADSFDLNDVAKNGKTETLDVNTVETTQRDLVPEKLKSIVNVGSVEKRDDDPVLVVRVNGKNIVVDGNHRCASALLLGQKTISAKVVEARRAVTIHPLEAAAGPLPGQIERVIVSLQNDGRLPIRIPPETMRHVAESLARYFQTASADKIEQFAEAAKAAVEAELKTVNVQTHDTMKADTTGVNVGATPATSRSVLTSFIESATGENIGGLMNMDFFNRIMREVTQGAGNFVAQNFDQTRLDEFPALELHRVYDREVPRGFKVGKGGAIIPDPDNDWPSRWEAAGGELVDGRMVALKSDPIWQALGDGEGGYEDTLGNPFAPFAFNSGYDTDEVSREDAVALGLMNDEDEAKPAEFDFTKLLNIEAASAASAGPLVLNANWPVESPANDRRRARLGLQAAAGDVPLVVKCFITDADGRLLVLQDDGYGRMDLPGGHLRAGETVEAGLRREVLEETGMTLNSVKELGTVLVPWNGQQPIVFFSAKADTDAPMALSDEHVDWFWLNRHEVALRNFSALTKVVNNFTDGKDLNEA